MNIYLSEVRDLFTAHYFFFAFLTSLGTIQISTANSGLRGLWLTPSFGVTRLVGVNLIITGVVIFFTQPLWVDGPWAVGSVDSDSATRAWGKVGWSELAAARNVNDIHGGLDGIKQAIWFSLAALSAFGVSVIGGLITIKIFSITGADLSRADQTVDLDDVGLEGLKRRSYFSNLPSSLTNFKSEFREVWKSGLKAADSWSVFNLWRWKSTK